MTSNPINAVESPATNDVRIVRGDNVGVTALYPASRLLKNNTTLANQYLADAERVLSDAKKSAESIVATADRDAGRIRDDAQREGRTEGLNEIETLVAELRGAVTRARNDLANDSARLAVMFARKILGAGLEASRASFVELVRNALEEARYYANITVVLHPEDLELIRSVGDSLLERLVFATSIQFREDVELSRFGCRIETEMGAFEASLDRQLERMSAIVIAAAEEKMSEAGDAVAEFESGPTEVSVS